MKSVMFIVVLLMAFSVKAEEAKVPPILKETQSMYAMCVLGNKAKKVELLEGKPCHVMYGDQVKWTYKVQVEKCKPVYDAFVKHLEKKGFTCH